MIWINLVGTYGLASAQYYWGRMAGLILRLLYNIAPVWDTWDPKFWRWLIVYVDDLPAFIHLAVFWEEATVILIFLEIIGAPINYKKVHVGLRNVFVGFHIDLSLIHI